MPPTGPQERLDEILREDLRYAPGAYEFTRQAVSYASDVVYARGSHVSGKELLEAIRQFALERYGLLTATVFESWGVKTTEDFGEIVFHLVDAGLLSKTEEDTKGDFRSVYSFDEVFSSRRYWETVLDSCL